MADEHDSWLGGIGVDVDAILQPLTKVASTLGEAAGAIGEAVSAKKAEDLPLNEQWIKRAFGAEGYDLRNADLANAHKIYKETGKIVATKLGFKVIEIKEGKPISQKDRYDLMFTAMLKDQGGPAGKHFTVEDLTNDNRDPDYLTKDEFKDEFYARARKELKDCDDKNRGISVKDKCGVKVKEDYGGKSWIEAQKGQEQQNHIAYAEYQGKVDNVANGGAGSLLGRVVGRAIGGEKGEEIGAAIGSLGDDAAVTIVQAKELKESVRGAGGNPEAAGSTQGEGSSASKGGGGAGEGGEGGGGAGAPPPTAVTDAEVVASNAKNPASIKSQEPKLHQETWKRLGGEGAAPSAYRDHDGTIRVSTDSVLLKRPTRDVVPPFSHGAAKSAPEKAKSDPGPAAPAKPPSKAPKDDPLADTVPPPKQSSKPPAEPLANTPPAPPPKPARPASASKKPADPAGPPQAPTGEAGSDTRRPQAQRGRIDPPQAVSQDAVERIRNQPQVASARKGRGSSVNPAVDHDHHELAWQRLGGHGEAPPAFIYDGQVYVDPSRWPPKP